MRASLSLVFLLLVVGCSEGDRRELRVYNWTDYIDTSVVSEFERLLNVRVVYDVYSSNDELYARIRSGSSGYDVVVPSDYMVSILVRESLLVRLDKSAIPNIGNLDSNFLSPAYDSGNQYSVPYFYGSTGIGFDSSNAALNRVVRQLGFGVFFSRLVEQRFTLADDLRYTMGLALTWLGYDVNSEDSLEIQRAGELLRSARPRIQAFTADTYIDMLATGAVVLSYGYSGDVVTASMRRPGVTFYAPTTGTILGVDNMSILAESRNKDLAHQWINFILEPRIHARIASQIHWGCPNVAALPMIPPQLRNDPRVYLPDSVARRSVFIRALRPEIEAWYADQWRRVLAG